MRLIWYLGTFLCCHHEVTTNIACRFPSLLHFLRGAPKEMKNLVHDFKNAYGFEEMFNDSSEVFCM